LTDEAKENYKKVYGYDDIALFSWLWWQTWYHSFWTQLPNKGHNYNAYKSLMTFVAKFQTSWKKI
jgi:hypothetical protein